MTALVFLHGWGYGPDVWGDLRARLSDIPSIAVDLGYFGAAHCPDLPDGKLIAIGHSLGFALALRHAPLFAAMVSINGFSRFSQAEDFQAGTAPRILRRMQSALGQAPAAVLAEFRRNAGDQAAAALPVNTAALARGLDLLARIDERQRQPKRLLVLAGKIDQIAPPALTHACFADVTWAEDGGHLLPISHPEFCADHIRRFIGALA